MRERLTEERADLVRDATAPLTPYSMDMADMATDEFEREMEWTEASSSQELLFEIDEALQRMRSGVYGICECSGRRLPHRRLEAVPSARFTAEVEEQSRREGVIPHVPLDAARSTQSQHTIPLAASPMESEDREPKMEDLAKLTGAESEDESDEGTEANENSKE
jgi:RNA polymerase-binding transcription factor DksA